MMNFKLSLVHPAPELFLQPIGGGILLVCDIHSVLCRGVSLTIVPVLSLCADQRKQLIDSVSQSCGRIISTHSDEIKNTTSVNERTKRTLLLTNDTTKSILLFISPQTIMDTPHWKQFVKDFSHFENY